MFRKNRFFLLTLILVSYSLLYIATSKRNCDADCETIIAMDSILKKDRDYIYYTARCSRPVGSDSICVWVKDTSGIDWHLLADTVCQIAKTKGLLQQKVFILRPQNSGLPDTVAQFQCP